MKQQLASLFRHAVTGAAGIGGFLASHGLLDAGDAAQVGADTAQAAQLLAGVAATVAARLILAHAGKIPLLRLLGWSKNNVSALCAMIAAVGAFALLPSCVTVTDPTGTKTTKPDTETVTTLGGLALQFAELFKPAPKPEPLPVTPAPRVLVDYRSGK